MVSLVPFVFVHRLLVAVTFWYRPAVEVGGLKWIVGAGLASVGTGRGALYL